MCILEQNKGNQIRYGKKKLSFISDYMEGAPPLILERLAAANLEKHRVTEKILIQNRQKGRGTDETTGGL